MIENSLPSRWIESNKFGFLAQMLRRQERLLLIKEGYWTLSSLPSWFTDIDVVTEGDRQGYLTTLFPLPESCLARFPMPE